MAGLRTSDSRAFSAASHSVCSSLSVSRQDTVRVGSAAAQQQRLRDFLAQRRTADGGTPALARENAQAQHTNLLSRNAIRAHNGSSTSLTAPWQPLGPSSVHTQLYGNVTGRVTAIALDPNDTSGNTVYVAMDTGVFVTQAVTTCASTNCWSPLGTGLPNAPVTTLEAAPQMPTGDGRSGMLRAGTYGRGLWQIPLLNATTIQAPAITLSSTSLTFTAQAVATQSTAQTITVASSGNQPVTFGTPAVTGDFVETDNCAGQTLATGATCTFNISFAPTKTGTRSGQLTIYANIPGGQATVSLSGTGTAAAAVVLTPLTLTFPATLINQTAASQIVTVANTGANPVIALLTHHHRRLQDRREHLRRHTRTSNRLLALHQLYPHRRRHANRRAHRH